MQRWYVVYSKPRKEEFALSQLRAKGLEVFYPKLLLPASSSRPTRVVPLFPSYLFVRINLVSSEYYTVIWSPGVKRIISFDGVPTPLEDGIVASLKDQADPYGLIPGRANLRIGQEVVIKSGPFDGLIGVVRELPDGKQRVKVLMELLSRQIDVEVPVHFLESGWVAGGMKYIRPNPSVRTLRVH
jgi:transcriptional antiterminator RfaH